MKRTRVIWVVLTAAALILSMSAGINYWLWGFWISPGSFQSDLRGARLAGIECFQFRGTSGPAIACEEQIRQASARVSSGLGIPGDEMLAAVPTRVSIGSESKIDSGLRAQCITWLEERAWRPRISDPAYAGGARSGVAALLTFDRNDGTRGVLAIRRFGEVGNDHYAYAEVLFETRRGDVTSVRELKYYFDVAGLEFLEFGGLVKLFSLATLLGLGFWWLASGSRPRRGAGRAVTN